MSDTSEEAKVTIDGIDIKNLEVVFFSFIYSREVWFYLQQAAKESQCAPTYGKKMRHICTQDDFHKHLIPDSVWDWIEENWDEWTATVGKQRYTDVYLSLLPTRFVCRYEVPNGNLKFRPGGRRLTFVSSQYAFEHFCITDEEKLHFKLFGNLGLQRSQQKSL